MTTFGDMVFQFGGAPLGDGMLPLLGSKASVFFVDPANGNDSQDGTKPDLALDTVTAAYNKTTDKYGDVIYLMNDGNTTGSARETASITWANDNTHLVGLCAPVGISQRARIVPTSGNTDLDAFTPMMTVSGHGNIFKNFHIGAWGSEDGKAARGVDVTGNRNYFDNVHIVGITHANVGDEAAACDLKITGSENFFDKCTIGVDTVARSAANASVDFQSQATRNVFRGCIFPMLADNAGALFIKADSVSDLDRFTLFKDCMFINAVESTGTSLTSAVSVNNSAGGMVILQGCIIVGADDVAAADNGNVFTTPIPAAATGALATTVTQ